MPSSMRTGMVLLMAVMVSASMLVACGARADQREEALEILNQRNIFFCEDEYDDALHRDDAALVDIFIKAGMNPNTIVGNEPPPIVTASFRGQAEMVRVLATQGGLVNFRSEKGHTPLMLAAINGHAEVCRILIENGAEVEATASYGMTALMYAVSHRYVEIADMLLAKNADALRKAETGASALTVAVETDQEPVIILLQKYGYGNAIKKHRARMKADAEAEAKEAKRRKTESDRKWKDQMDAVGAGKPK